MIEDVCISAMIQRVGIEPTEDRLLRAVWEAAWLREYRCQVRYQSLLVLDTTAELTLRFAWLDWWDANCACRTALRLLEDCELSG